MSVGGGQGENDPPEVPKIPPTPHPHMGADFFPEGGGKNVSKIVIPEKWL